MPTTHTPSAFRYTLYSVGNALNADTLVAMTIAPRKASRQPMFVFAFDESLFAFAYATPPFVFEP